MMTTTTVVRACTEHGCEAPATRKAFGPHGVVLYCDDHAAMFMTLAVVLGWKAMILPLDEEVPA